MYRPIKKELLGDPAKSAAWLPWAQRKLQDLVWERESLGLPFHQRRFQVPDGTITISTSNYEDKIRIEVNGELPEYWQILYFAHDGLVTEYIGVDVLIYDVENNEFEVQSAYYSLGYYTVPPSGNVRITDWTSTWTGGGLHCGRFDLHNKDRFVVVSSTSSEQIGDSRYWEVHHHRHYTHFELKWKDGNLKEIYMLNRDSAAVGYSSGSVSATPLSSVSKQVRSRSESRRFTFRDCVYDEGTVTDIATIEMVQIHEVVRDVGSDPNIYVPAFTPYEHFEEHIRTSGGDGDHTYVYTASLITRGYGGADWPFEIQHYTESSSQGNYASISTFATPTKTHNAAFTKSVRLIETGWVSDTDNFQVWTSTDPGMNLPDKYLPTTSTIKAYKYLPCRVRDGDYGPLSSARLQTMFLWDTVSLSLLRGYNVGEDKTKHSMVVDVRANLCFTYAYDIFEYYSFYALSLCSDFTLPDSKRMFFMGIPSETTDRGNVLKMRGMIIEQSTLGWVYPPTERGFEIMLGEYDTEKQTYKPFSIKHENGTTTVVKFPRGYQVWRNYFVPMTTTAFIVDTYAFTNQEALEELN